MLPRRGQARQPDVREEGAPDQHVLGLRGPDDDPDHVRAAKPTPAQVRLEIERARLDRALLGALLDFVHGKEAWDARVLRRSHGGFIRFGQLVAMADEARAGQSTVRMIDIRKALDRI